MQKTQLIAAALQQAAPAALPKGPVPLEVQQLKQVCGGSPKGGWMVAGDASAKSPKGGW